MAPRRKEAELSQIERFQIAMRDLARIRDNAIKAAHATFAAEAGKLRREIYGS